MLIGGEESGGIGLSRHLPERDGLLNALLLAGVMAEEQKTLAELVANVQAAVWRAPLQPRGFASARVAKAGRSAASERGSY
jgi:phosphomannomutase